METLNYGSQALRQETMEERKMENILNLQLFAQEQVHLNVKYTDIDVDNIIRKKFVTWKKKQQKVVEDTKKETEMLTQLKWTSEKKQLQTELDELKKKYSLLEVTYQARKRFYDEGIPISDELLSMIISTDIENTKRAVEGFIMLFTDTVERAVKEKLKGNAPICNKAEITR